MDKNKKEFKQSKLPQYSPKYGEVEGEFLSKENIKFRQDYLIFDNIYCRMKTALHMETYPEYSYIYQQCNPYIIDNIKNEILLLKERNNELGTALESIFYAYNINNQINNMKGDK